MFISTVLDPSMCPHAFRIPTLNVCLSTLSCPCMSLSSSLSLTTSLLSAPSLWLIPRGIHPVDLGGAWSKRERPRDTERSSLIVGGWQSASSEIGRERVPEEGTMGVTGRVCTRGTESAKEADRPR